MCSMSVLCPLCAQTSFSNIDALRCSLIKAANGPLACPICHELFLGLDKLTIHLFSHTHIMHSANSSSHHVTTTPTTHNQNVKLIEATKIQQIENVNNINNNNTNTNDTSITTQTLPNQEVNFSSAQSPQCFWGKNIMRSPKKAAAVASPVAVAVAAGKADNTLVSNLSVTQQQLQQQVVEPLRPPGHENSTEVEKVAQCDICEFTFRNVELRNMHIRLVHQNFKFHSAARNAECNNKSSTGSTLTENDCQNSPAEYDHDFKCHLCAKTFKTKGSLRLHLKVVHLMGRSYINSAQKLTICDRIRHKENKMLKTANPTGEDPNENSATLLDYSKCSNNSSPFHTSPVNFLGNQPLKSISTASNIAVVNCSQSLQLQHDQMEGPAAQVSNVLFVLNTSSEPKDMVPNSHATSSVLTEIATTTTTTHSDNDVLPPIENPKIWECDVCSKAFTTKYFLKKHKRLHTGEMPYTCELCARTFTFQQSYHKHLLYHSDEKPHVCSTCGRAFKELSTLHNHERIHSGEKPFKCEVCGKSFRQRVSFLVHTRIHTGVMPYKCEICQRSFRYKVSQRTHKCQTFSIEETRTCQNENAIDNVSENFINAFLEASATNQNEQHLNQSHNSPASNEIAAINEKASTLNEQQALLAKTIDDIVVESCNKMGIGSDGVTTARHTNEGSMSPSQKLQNMRLYSPPQMVTPDLNAIDGDLTRFFLDNSQAGNNLL